MTIRVALSVVALIAGIATAYADAPVPRGTKGHLARGSYGCPDMPGYVKMVLEKADKDGMFAARELGDRFSCVTIKANTSVLVEDESKVGLGYACLKIDGQAKCLWTVNSNIVPD